MFLFNIYSYSGVAGYIFLPLSWFLVPVILIPALPLPLHLLFLLLWLYKSLCRVLAFSSNSFHLLLSWTRVFQFGTFSFCIPFLTSSSQRVFGLPLGLFEMSFQECIALNILVSCTLSIRPSHPNLCTLMKFIMFLYFIILSSSWLVFIRQMTFSFFGPSILLTTFLSKIISLLVIVYFSVHVSHACVTTGLITEQ